MYTEEDWQSGKTLQESNRFMFENEVATDVTFVFPGSEAKVKAHRFVLMSRSHVMFVMFSHTLDKPGKDIEISDIEPGAFRELLKFLYYDDIPITSEDILQLLYSAQKYEVEMLKAKCLEFLQTNLDVSNVGLILDQAVFYGEAKLHSTCLHFLSRHSAQSLNDYHVSRDTLLVIVECDSLRTDEVFIVRACDRWAIEECKKTNIAICADNKRKVLGSILKKIHFCSMTNEEIASTVSPIGLLSVQEEVAVFRYIGAPDETNAPFPYKKRLPVHVMLPPELTKDNMLNDTNEFFHLSIICGRKFKLLGFFFTEMGIFKIKLNNSIQEEFIVMQPEVNMYLEKPLVCDVNNTLEICNHHGNEKAYIITERLIIKHTNNRLNFQSPTPYHCNGLPFNALILAP